MTYNLQPSYPDVSVLTTQDKAISVMYGRYSDGTLIPLLVDAIGALKTSTANILAFNSNPSVGGATSEILTVTGLLATDTILAVTQMTHGATATAAFVSYSNQANNSLTAYWTVDPGVGAVIRVLVSR